MIARNVLLASAGLFAFVPTPAAGNTTLPLDLAAKVFGARPSASAPDLSPAGDKIVYIAAGPGTANVVRVLDLKTKQTTDVIASAGKPDSLNWCEFASEEWLVCHYRGDVPYRTAILGMSRLIAIDIKTKQTNELGVKGRYDEAATIRQNDGFVISYPSDGGPSVIMARNYVMGERGRRTWRDGPAGFGRRGPDCARYHEGCTDRPGEALCRGSADRT